MEEIKKPTITPEDARTILWRKPNLTFKLDKNQTEMYENFKNTYSKIVVWACSRRLGKSRTLCVIALETCLKKNNAKVIMLAPKQRDIKMIIRPLIRDLIADAPEDIRPIEKASSGIWYFPSTGSEIQVAGCDGGRAESVRGKGADLCLVDEAAFVSKDLKYIVNSILLPTTATTKGKIILASTPPKSFDHEFREFVNNAIQDNAFVKKTVFDNPRFTQEDIDILAEACGGYDTVDFKREYLAEFRTDDKRAIIPEFTAELKESTVREYERPPFFDWYVAMDIGMRDLTVALFAYYDFQANKLIIEDEFIINGQLFTTQTLAAGIKEKEQALFTDRFGSLIPPKLRVSDNNLILINDLYRLHGIPFYPTRKDDKDAALNNLRILLKDEKIIINPRCSTLIKHLEFGTWNKDKTSYERSSDHGHFDAIDALVYLVRNVDFSHNPYPDGFGKSYGFNSFKMTPSSANKEAWMKIMNMRSKKPY